MVGMPEGRDLMSFVFEGTAARRSVRGWFSGALMWLVVIGGGSAGSSWAAERLALVDRDSYHAALSASKEGQHEVAAVRYERVLDERGLSKDERRRVEQRLVDALLRARLAERALERIEKLKKDELLEWGFYRGQALLMLKRYRDAELQLKDYLNEGGPYVDEARLALGKVIIAQGRESSGRRELQLASESKNPQLARWARLLWNESEMMLGRGEQVLKRLEEEGDSYEVQFLKACVALQTGELKRAASGFRALGLTTARQGIRKPLRDAAEVRLAETYVKMDRRVDAERVMLHFISEDVESIWHEPAFAILESVRTEQSPLTLGSYDMWASDPRIPSRHALGLYYAALRRIPEGKIEEARDLLEKYFELYPAHERSNEVVRLLMSLHGMLRNDARVMELANEWRRRYGTGGEDMVDYLTAMVFFGRQEYDGAAELFKRAAERAHDMLVSNLAFFNRAVCGVKLGDEKMFRECLVELSKPEAMLPESNARNLANVPRDQGAHLLLERGLALAAARDVAAETTLQEFITKYPKHPRLVEAHLALAEYCLLSVPIRARTARMALDAAQELHDIPEKMQEALAYARLWLAEAEGNLAQVAEAGNAYLRNWTESSRRDEVRMKMAQAYYRLGDFAKAETEFEKVDQESPSSPYAETALFFAGKAAMNLPSEGIERALTLWAEVVARKGPLAREAQRQQAMAKRRQGKEAEALPVIENLLSSKDLSVEERLHLSLERGELLELLGKNDEKRMNEAMEVFKSVANDQAGSYDIRARAGVMLSRGYRQLKRNIEALEALYQVVEEGLRLTSQRSLNSLEYVWFYRAGFTALDLLEEDNQWESAAKLADRMVTVGGDRAEEAQSRATGIRLKHFLWDD